MLRLCPRRLWTTPEIADFEYKMVGGPGFEPEASRSRNLGGFVH